MMEENMDNCVGNCHGCSGCGESHDDAYIPNEISPIITLTDENGVDSKFEILDVVVIEDGREFLVVTESKEENDDEDVEVVILEIKQENGEEVYDTVTDDKLAEQVFNEFMSQQESLAESLSEDDE